MSRPVLHGMDQVLPSLLTQREVAEFLGISVQAVQQHEARAVHKIFRELRDDPELRRLYDEHYGLPEDGDV